MRFWITESDSMKHSEMLKQIKSAIPEFGKIKFTHIHDEAIKQKLLDFEVVKKEER